MTPYYDEDGITIYHGDCREVLPDLDLTSVDTIIMDPPYSSGGYQESGKAGGSIGSRGSETIALDNLSTRGYQRLLRSVFRHCWSVDEAFVFTDWRMWVHTSDAMEDAGWRVRNMLVWDKGQMGMGMPWRNQHELIAYGKRTAGSIVSGKYGNVLNNPRANGFHPTEKPVDLIRRFLLNSEASTVLDPFMGSGPVARACQDLNRRYVGIELVEEYCAIAVQRLAQGVLAL